MTESWPMRREYVIQVTVADSDAADRLAEALLDVADLVDPGQVVMSASPSRVGSYAECRFHSCAAITVTPNAAGWGFGLCPRHLAVTGGAL